MIPKSKAKIQPNNQLSLTIFENYPQILTFSSLHNGVI